MQWAVAARFPGEGPTESMPLSLLRYWYRGHEYMVGEERKAMQAMIGGRHG
jgi:hypothetical protein